MCWQDGCRAEKPKTAEQQPTWPPHLSLIKTIPSKGDMAYFFWLVRTAQIELIFVSSEFKNAFICLISYWVSHCSRSQKTNVLFIPITFPFTVCSSPLLPTGSSSKITRMFSSASCYNLLLVGWPCYTAADSGQVWCIRRTRCWSSTASPS